MANADFARGLVPLRHMSGAPYNGATNRYYVAAGDSTAIYVGGLVKLAGSADADGIASITGNVSTGDAVIGVVQGFALSEDSSTDETLFRAGSTLRYVLVADDPNLIFEVQEDSTGGALAATAVGNVADLTGFTSGNTANGLSSIEIDSSTASAAGDGTQDVLIWGLSQSPDNAIGDNANWLVRLNNHALVDGFTGA